MEKMSHIYIHREMKKKIKGNEKKTKLIQEMKKKQI
jgi:hypothetical protein